MSVFVLDRSGKPLMPCSEKRASTLLESGRARVHRLHPFVIRLTDRMQADSALQPQRIKLDPGSKTTGLALVRDAATANATRWALANALKATDLPVELASGGLTKFNHMRHGIEKTHAWDAVCVGQVDALRTSNALTMSIKATGRGSYQRTRLDKFGFPRGYLTRQKRIQGFRTGDMVTAIVPGGKKMGTHSGRVAVRESGYFNIQTANAVVQGIGHKHCRLMQRNDGYGYFFNRTAISKRDQAEVQAKDAEGVRRSASQA